MSLVDSSNNYNSNNGQGQQGQEQQHGYLASRHLVGQDLASRQLMVGQDLASRQLMVGQDLASRHPTLLKQLNSPPTICKCSGQSRLVSCPTR